MQRLFPVLCLAAFPALADGTPLDTCVIDNDLACPVEAILPDLHMIDGDPVVTGPDRLTFVAREKNAAEKTFAIDISLADGHILRKMPLGVAREGTLMFDWLIAPGGQGYLLLVWEDRRDRVLLFFDADGTPRARMPDVRPQGWPYDLTLAGALMLLGRQNVLTFDGNALSGRVGGFSLTVTAADARLDVVAVKRTTGDDRPFEDAVLDRLIRQIPEAGNEAVHVEGHLTVVTTFESLDAPSRLFLRTEAGEEIAVDPSPGPDATHRWRYRLARLSQDTRFLAVVRSADREKRLVVFDTATKAVLFEAALRSCLTAGLRWLPDGRIAHLCFRMRDGIEIVVLDTGLPD